MNLDLYQQLLSQNRHTEALAICDEALSDNPRDANIWHLKGFVHRLMGDFPAAISAQERSLDLEPGQIPVLMALGIARQLGGDFEGALEEFRKVQAINPYHSAAYNSAALTREKMGNVAKAAELYEAAMQVLVDSIVLGLENRRENTYVPSGVLVAGEWWRLVSKSVLKMAARAGVAAVVLPTPDMADCPIMAKEYGGSYWFDFKSDDRLERVLLPNFYQTVCLRLKSCADYSLYAQNLSNVLQHMGDAEASARWLSESTSVSDAR